MWQEILKQGRHQPFKLNKLMLKLKILAKIIILMNMNISHLGPADITGHDSEVQYSVIVPYSMLIWLKKSTARNKEKQL